MTNLTPIECEARLVGLSKQRRKDGDWIEVKFHIHPDDHPAALFILPLGTDCNLSIKGTEEIANEGAGDKTEQPAERVKPKIGPICMRAVIKCKEPAFQDHLYAHARALRLVWPAELDRNEAAAAILKRLCNIESRRTLDDNAEAALAFERIMDDFHASRTGQTTAAQQTQLESGPA